MLKKQQANGALIRMRAGGVKSHTCRIDSTDRPCDIKTAHLPQRNKRCANQAVSFHACSPAELVSSPPSVNDYPAISLSVGNARQRETEKSLEEKIFPCEEGRFEE